jgi:hypothetical protein
LKIGLNPMINKTKRRNENRDGATPEGAPFRSY